MNLTAQRLIASGALDIRARYIRLLSLLERIAGSATASERRILDSVIEETREALSAYVDGIGEVIEGGKAMLARTQDAPWPSNYRQHLVTQVESGYEGLRRAHLNAYPYISGRTSVPDDLRHFLFRALDLSLVSQTHREAVAIYPSHHMMWESSSTRIGTDDRVTAGILIPYGEITAPGRWPLLVHELGHHISPGGLSSDKLRKAALGEDQGSRDDALSELQADRIAENATGPTYALAMAREGYLLRIGKHSKQGGPTVKQRLEQLRYGGAVAAALPEEWHLDGTRVTTTGQQEEVMGPQEIEQLNDFAAELAPTAGDTHSTVRVNLARALLRNDDPIPSVPRRTTLEGNIFERAAEKNLAEIEVEKLFASVVEDPLSDSEILEAAWLEELDQDDNAILDELVKSTDSKLLAIEMSKLEANDVRLSRSLQAAAVHRWLLANDEEIAQRAARKDPGGDAPSESSMSYPSWFENESSPISDVQMVRRLGLNVGDPKRLVVRPVVDPDQLGGTTIDLRLGTEWETLRTSRFRSLDPSDEQAEVTDLLNRSSDEFRLAADDPNGLVLHPGELLLALSLEYLSLPNDLWGNLEGRSTWARLGLQVHATAGMVDAGFRGFLTFELQNTGRLPIVLYPGIRVAQMAFFPVAGIARPYGAKSGAAYSNQARVRTAFTNQHEHRARHAYLRKEEQAERARNEEEVERARRSGTNS